MNKVLFLISFFSCFGAAYAQQHFLEYDLGKSFNGIPSNTPVNVRLEITEGESSKLLYSEQQVVITDSSGGGVMLIGKGIKREGHIDSIIWSVGSFHLSTQIDIGNTGTFSSPRKTTIRVPPDLNRKYEQGTVSATEFPDHGEWSIPNAQHQRPRLVHIDLSTSYANLAYPADTYPVYRHFEWLDEDRDGKGEAFMLSYSDHTNHSFLENTTILGAVKLYSKPFQTITISTSSSNIGIKISEAVPVKNLSETYAIKGPWKFIYYIEW